ncbi:MAG: hypothetical protein K6E91_04845 [Butyrivibrio sp.]|nr:hypothetical protein [Butyrivibrio sp.]
MRAVVIAIKENKAAVAGSGGHFGYIDNNGYEVGQILEVAEEVFDIGEETSPEAALKVLSKENGKEIDYAAKKRPRVIDNVFKSLRFDKFIAVAAVMLLFIGMNFANAATAYTVSLGGDASVELSMNVFDRVVGINAGDNEVSGVYTGLFFSKLSMAYEKVLESVENLNDETDGETYVSATVEVNSFLGESKVTAVINELTMATDNWNESQNRAHVNLDFSGKENPAPVKDKGGIEKESAPVIDEGTEKEKSIEEKPQGTQDKNQGQEENNRENPTDINRGSNENETQQREQNQQPETDNKENTDKPAPMKETKEDNKSPASKPDVKENAGKQSEGGARDNNAVQPPPKPDQGIGQEGNDIPDKSVDHGNQRDDIPDKSVDHDNPPEPDINTMPDKIDTPGSEGNPDDNNDPGQDHNSGDDNINENAPPEPPGNEDHNGNHEEPQNMGGSGH